MTIIAGYLTFSQHRVTRQFIRIENSSIHSTCELKIILLPAACRSNRAASHATRSASISTE